MRIPELELLWWEGCPSTDAALAQLREALAELGLERAQVAKREIDTDEQASAERFRGSPTILIDGVDFAFEKLSRADANEQPIGLTCRIYRRRDGRISPTPDPEDLREALREAATRQEVRS
jgi:hypothetical protein